MKNKHFTLTPEQQALVDKAQALAAAAEKTQNPPSAYLRDKFASEGADAIVVTPGAPSVR